MSESDLEGVDPEIIGILNAQRAYFKSGATLNVNTRIYYLKKLRESVKANLGEIHAGLKADLGKSEGESYMCETGLALSGLSFMIKRLKRFSKPARVSSPLSQFPSESYVIPSPYGNVLIMNPWNYPFLLSIDPLVAAIAAGNTAVVKLSAYSPNVNAVIKRILGETFPSGYVDVLLGGARINGELMRCKFDYVFFTGSKRVGKLVYENAAKSLTPVTLELGGKSPCIVDGTADIPLAAKRIVWGKFLNCGQTCVAPDYVLCEKSVHDRLVSEIKKQIEKQFSDDPLHNPFYGKIINEKHFDRISGLIDAEKVVHGGKSDRKSLKIEPTVMDNADFSDAVMQEEIFGPVLPVIIFESEDEALNYVESNPAPLALYAFAERKKADFYIKRLGFGGGCVNDVVVHLATPYMPFGGFKDSGLGSYHGKAGFDTFTHYKSVLKKSTKIDLPMRYRPCKKLYHKLIKLFLK